MWIIMLFVVAMIIAVGSRIYQEKSSEVIDQLKKQTDCIYETYKNCFLMKNEDQNIIDIYLQRILLTASGILNIGLGLGWMIYRCEARAILMRTFGMVWRFFWILRDVISIGIVVFFLIWGLGYLLMSIDSIHQAGSHQRDESIKLCVLLNYFILSIFEVIFWIYGARARVCYSVILLLLGVNQVLNLLIFIKIIRSSGQKSSEQASFGRSVITAILLIVLAVMGMYLAVRFTAICFPGSYESANNLLDLFYYVVVTFFTIGYGDVAPMAMYSRLVACGIIISSPVYLILFLGKVVSFK